MVFVDSVDLLVAIEAAKFAVHGMRIGNGFCDQAPEVLPVVHVVQVAQFVNDEIILKVFGEEYDAIAEIQVLLGRTAPPFCLLVLDENLVVGKVVVSIPVFEFCVNECAGLFFVFEIFLAGTGTTGNAPAARADQAYALCTAQDERDEAVDHIVFAGRFIFP